MSAYKRRNSHVAKATSDLARRRVVAVIACLKVLCPSADRSTQQRLATEILTLVRGEDQLIHKKTINPAAVYEMITRHSQ